MNEDILDFLQAITQSDTIPDVSPAFNQPFSVLNDLDVIDKRTGINVIDD